MLSVLPASPGAVPRASHSLVVAGGCLEGPGREGREHRRRHQLPESRSEVMGLEGNFWALRSPEKVGSGLGQDSGLLTHSILAAEAQASPLQQTLLRILRAVSACDKRDPTQECVMTPTAYLVTVFPLGHTSPRAGSVNTQVTADFSPGTANPCPDEAQSLPTVTLPKNNERWCGHPASQVPLAPLTRTQLARRPDGPPCPKG